MRHAQCPKCHRLYDVSHVAEGRPIRCLCDQIFNAVAVKPRETNLLRCPSCGATVDGKSPDCPHCGGKIPVLERNRSGICPKCSARHPFDAEFCSGCGAPIAPQSLVACPADAACPRCDGELRSRTLGSETLIECSLCLGIWLQPSRFEAVTQKARSDAAALPQALRQAPPPKKHEFKYLKCLGCGDMMVPRNFAGSSGILIDVCMHHGVWLDHAELEAIIRWVREHRPEADAMLIKQKMPPSPEKIYVPVERPSMTGYMAADIGIDVVLGLLRSFFN
jgi:Zn-finger nucleic acid-binding protein